MSKEKLRRKNKIFADNGVIERAGKWHWVNRETIKMVTHFACENNSLYIEAINWYYNLPFAIHELWIERVDLNNSKLMVAWNGVNQRLIHDLSPFWNIFFSLKFEKGLTDTMHYNPTVAEAMDYLTKTEIKYQPPKLPKEKYLAYRRKFSDKRTFDWQMKKVQLELANITAKRRRELKNKTKYTWSN